MPFPWGAAISAGAPLVGGLVNSIFGKKQDNYHPEVWRNDMYKNYLQQIRAVKDAAGQYGFHPLALLGANVSGGGFANPTSISPGFGIGDSVGDALSAFGDLYQRDQDSQEYKAERAEELKRYQRDRALDILRSKEVTPEVRMQRENMALQNDLLRLDIAQSRSRLAGLRSSALGGARPTLTDALGIKMTPPAGRASAQQMQDEYGDIVENVYGVGNWVQDMWSAKSPAWWDELFDYKLPSTGSRQPDYRVPVY